MPMKPLINLGTSVDSGTGDSPRAGGAKTNALFLDVYANLGDNPVVDNPLDAFYGTRTEVINDALVGDLHPAGYWLRITAQSSGVTRAVDGSDANTYYASSGEQIAIDFSELSTSEAYNVILPIANKGDTIKLRDAFATLEDSKVLKVWTTPLEYTGTDPWLYGEVVLGVPEALPSGNHTKINGVNYSYLAVSSGGNTPIDLATDGLSFTENGITIEFVYSGDDTGWSYYVQRRESPRSQIGQLIFENPIFAAASRPTYPDETIYFNPTMLDGPLQERNNPIVTGTQSYIEGDDNASNTVQIDSSWLQNRGNGLILKSVSDSGTYDAPSQWRVELAYPQSIPEQDLLYKGRTITIINNSGLPILLAPLIWQPDGTQNPGKDTTVNSDLANYTWITNSYDVDTDTTLEDLGNLVNANAARVDLVFTDSIALPNGKTDGWSITNIEFIDTSVSTIDIIDGGTW